MPQISGVTKDALGVPVSAVVDVHRHDNGALVERVVTDPADGTYVVHTDDDSLHVVTRHVAPVVAGHQNWAEMAFGFHFGAGGIRDVKGAPVVTTGTPTIATDAASPGGSSLHMPAGSSLAFSPQRLPSGTEPFAIGLGMRTVSGTSYCTVMSHDNGLFTSAGAWALMFNPGSASGVIEFWCSDYATGAPMLSAAGVNVADGTRHYVELNRTGNLWELSVDGVVKASRTWAGSVGALNVPITIGRSPGYSRDFEGYVDEVLVIAGAALHTGAFTVPSTPFLGSPQPGTPTSAAQVEYVTPGTPPVVPA